MIFPEGYMPLIDLADALIAENKRMHATQGPFEGPETKAARQAWADGVDHAGFFEGMQTAWNFCDDETNFPYTMLENGNVVRISQKMMLNNGVDPIGTFVSLTIGNLGSGSGYFTLRDFLDADSEPDINELEWHLGPFFGLPVLYVEKVARAYIDRHSKWGGAPKAPDHAKVASLIVSAFDDNPRFTKAEARKNFAPHMKYAEFIATWQIAICERPLLSKPGRKPDI